MKIDNLELTDMTYFQVFEAIKELTNYIWQNNTDARVAGCCSDIRVGVNRYFRECIPKRGD